MDNFVIWWTYVENLAMDGHAIIWSQSGLEHAGGKLQLGKIMPAKKIRHVHDCWDVQLYSIEMIY
ncbi:protein of unknown function [Candidatus Nitrosotalea okcheonensis]|uniref:Uncharacterized protein n=1 Tax=Candidatus Nitrosotalea okcheonensis TaxID=1903276 RepID=A0A2H1FCW4_9ARCH|nr:protein of unknown function [Candidatus Nitrosotalea okcheonensis]